MNQAARLSYRRAPAQRSAEVQPRRARTAEVRRGPRTIEAQPQLGRVRAITRVPPRPASLRNWWISAASLGLAAVVELILAGRMVVQTMDVHGALAQFVFDAGGFLQGPFVDISKQPVYAHGVFEPDTIRAIIAYAAIGLIVPALGLVSSVPGGAFGIVRGTVRLIAQTGAALIDLTKSGARGARWAWITAPQLSREAGPALSRARLQAAEASSRVGPALSRARIQAVEASRHVRPALEQGRERITAAAQQVRPAANQALAGARERRQQLDPLVSRSRDWAQQASREALALLKELQAWAISAAQIYRRWADGLAAKRH